MTLLVHLTMAPQALNVPFFRTFSCPKLPKTDVLVKLLRQARTLFVRSLE